MYFLVALAKSQNPQMVGILVGADIKPCGGWIHYGSKSDSYIYWRYGKVTVIASLATDLPHIGKFVRKSPRHCHGGCGSKISYTITRKRHISTRSCATRLHPHSHPLANNHDQEDDVSYRKRRLKQQKETGIIDHSQLTNRPISGSFGETCL